MSKYIMLQFQCMHLTSWLWLQYIISLIPMSHTVQITAMLPKNPYRKTEVLHKFI